MSPNPEKNNESTAAPDISGNNNASEQKSALTVELSPLAAAADTEGKTSAFTAQSPDSEPQTLPPETVNASEATVVRNKNSQQDLSDSHSSRTEIYSAHNDPNDGVIIVNNDTIDGYIPTRLGAYQIVQKIGAGGMGNIFLAVDVYLDREAAIKILLPKYQSTELQERFIVEAKASAKLHHENIVTIYTFGETNNLPYFAMEYIPGSNLRNIVNKTGVLSVENTLSYAIQIASALEHINEKGIVHRDIKPSNIIVTDNGTVKVIDLGLAKDFVQQQDDELTKTGVTLGTFDYISPEQAIDPRHVDIRADIYSLGCTMFFMLVGKPPFADKNQNEKLRSHQSDTTPNIRLLRPKIPERLADIVMHCMEKNPDKRYQTPQELSRDLYIAAEEQGMRPSRYSLSKWHLPSKSRLIIWKDRLAWALPIVLLFIAITVLNCFWQPDKRQSEFLPEAPSLKRSETSENSNGRVTPIFGSPVKRGKTLEFDSIPQSFPQPPEINPAESDSMQPPVVVGEQNPVPDTPVISEQNIPPTSASSKIVQPTREPNAPAITPQEQFIPNSNSPNASQGNAAQDNSNQNKIIHSVKLETD